MRLIAVSLFLFVVNTIPVNAATKPSDPINILNSSISRNASQESEKIEQKPWSKLKLDAKTRKRITAINNHLDQEGPEKFRLIWIRIINTEIQRVMFQGNRSTIWVYDMLKLNPDKERCYITVDGNGMMSGCQ
jgi:hypothetical protein